MVEILQAGPAVVGTETSPVLVETVNVLSLTILPLTSPVDVPTLIVLASELEKTTSPVDAIYDIIDKNT